MKNLKCISFIRNSILICISFFCLSFFNFAYAKGGCFPDQIKVQRINSPTKSAFIIFPMGGGSLSNHFTVYPGDQLKITIGYKNPRMHDDYYFRIWGWYLSIAGFSQIFPIMEDRNNPLWITEINYTVPLEPKVNYTFRIIADVALPVGNTTSFSELSNNQYIVQFTVKDKIGIITPPTWNDSLQIRDSIQIRPLRNPVSEVLPVQIEGSQESVTLQLFDASGNVKKTLTTAEKQVQLNVADLKRGRYILRGKGLNGQTQSKHVIIE